MMTFNAIDVETANEKKWSICQIGVCFVKNGEIFDQWDTLVNPKVHFKQKQVDVHGIQEPDVRDAPTLQEVYGELCKRVSGSVLVHHGSHDETAFDQATSKYQLSPLPVTWLNTEKVARMAWPSPARSGYKLKTLADRFGIQFNHHEAVEDARASALIMLQACRDTGWDIDEFLNRVN